MTWLSPYQRNMADQEPRPINGEAIAASLARTVSTAVNPLSTADKNRVLLALAALIASQLEALETNTDR